MSFVTYLWHYTVARLLYDDVVHPLGFASAALVMVGVALVLVRRRGGRR